MSQVYINVLYKRNRYPHRRSVMKKLKLMTNRQKETMLLWMKHPQFIPPKTVRHPWLTFPYRQVKVY